MDFGVVKENDSEHTAVGELIGTVAAMSAEMDISAVVSVPVLSEHSTVMAAMSWSAGKLVTMAFCSAMLAAAIQRWRKRSAKNCSTVSASTCRT